MKIPRKLGRFFLYFLIEFYHLLREYICSKLQSRCSCIRGEFLSEFGIFDKKTYFFFCFLEIVHEKTIFSVLDNFWRNTNPKTHRNESLGHSLDETQGKSFVAGSDEKDSSSRVRKSLWNISLDNIRFELMIRDAFPHPGDELLVPRHDYRELLHLGELLIEMDESVESFYLQGECIFTNAPEKYEYGFLVEFFLLCLEPIILDSIVDHFDFCTLDTDADEILFHDF